MKKDLSLWLRRKDLHLRPSGHEPDELLLLHSAIWTPIFTALLASSPQSLSGATSSRGAIRGGSVKNLLSPITI